MVISVTSPADGGPNTLRAAVAAANAATQPVEIDFHLKGAATITLTSGQLELSNTARSIAIVGPGADRLTVDGDGASRVFKIDPSVTASISGLSVTGGFTSDAGGALTGAGLLNQGNLTLTGVTVSHNTTIGSYDPLQPGGGLVNLGVATVVGCTFADNAGVYGGGISNGGTATLRNCSFVDNTATFYGGGMENFGSATLDACSFVGNATQDGNGGGFSGVGLQSGLTTSSELSNCSFIGNTAENEGGGLGFGGTLSAPLQVLDCVFRDNQAADGGGLVLEGTNSMTVTVTGCLIEDNRAIAPLTFDGGAAGGLGVRNTATTVTDCIISNNYTNGYSGGMSANGSSLTMTDVTISGNSAPIQGGGLTLAGPATLTDCTISGNSSGQGGGLVMFGRANAALVACTVSGNTATTPGGGGGLYSYPYYGVDPSVTMTDTIIAGNSASDGASDFASDYVGPVTGSYNLVGTGAPGGLTAANHNILNVTDPGLAPLGDYGGPTETMALLPGSPAIHAGVAVPGVTTDQRGFSLDSAPDIGAFQSRPGPLVVDTAIDGIGSGLGQLSLRQAVNLANVLQGGDAITFDKTTFAGKQTITLDGGPLELSNATGPISLAGTTAARLTISGGGASRVFQVDLGANATLSNLTIAGGVASGNGGGVLNAGTLTLANVLVAGDTASGGGGGVYNSGSLFASNVRISGDQAANGGGIDNTGNAVILGSSIDGNSATSDGGGIDNSGFLSLGNSDLSANSAGLDGGGLFDIGTATLFFCTLDSNAAASGGGIFVDPSTTPAVLVGTTLAKNKGGNIVGSVIKF